MYRRPQPEASSVVQVEDVHDRGAVDPHSQRRSLVVVVGTTHVGFRSRRPGRHLPAAETAAQRTQSLVEDY